MSTTPPNTVESTGASSGDVLLGIHREGNTGLIVRIFEPQRSGHGGRIRGPFKVLHEGSGIYSAGIRAVLDTHSVFERAEDFIRMVSGEPGCEKCTHVLNANALWRLDIPIIYEKIVNPVSESLVAVERRCSTCGRVYNGAEVNFCLDDGTSLVPEMELETLVRTRGHVARRTRKTGNPAVESIPDAVARHPNLSLKVHPGLNHRIMKSSHTGSIWIIPRSGGVSITANGEGAQQLYREIDALVGKHHREDKKGYRCWQVDDPAQLEILIAHWSRL